MNGIEILLTYVMLGMIAFLLQIWYLRKYDGGLDLADLMRSIGMSLIWPVTAVIGIVVLCEEGNDTIILKSYKDIKELKQKNKGYDN